MMNLDSFLTTNRVQPKLGDMSLLRGLPEQVILEAESRCVWKLYHKDATILTQDDRTRDVVLVKHGLVRVVQFTASGREISYADIGPGGHFGEIAAIDGGPRSAYVVALADTVAAVLPAKEFLGLISRYPALALNVMRSLTAIIRGTNLRVRDLSTLKAPERVAVELIRLARHLSRGERATSITLRPAPTATEIANRATTTRETVARALSDFTRQGLIRRVGQDLEILDVFGLEASVENFDGVMIDAT